MNHMEYKYSGTVDMTAADRMHIRCLHYYHHRVREITEQYNNTNDVKQKEKWERTVQKESKNKGTSDAGDKQLFKDAVDVRIEAVATCQTLLYLLYFT